MPDTAPVTATTPYDDPDAIRAHITSLHEQLDALPTDNSCWEQRRDLRYQIAERTQAWHMAVRRQRQHA